MWYTILITLVLDVGGLLLVYVLLRDRVRRATSAEAQIAEIRDEVSRLVVELNQTTDRNIALVEDRIASLNEQLSVADKKIGLLRREIEKHDVGAQVYNRLGETRPKQPPPLPPLSVELSEKAPTEGRDELASAADGRAAEGRAAEDPMPSMSRPAGPSARSAVRAEQGSASGDLRERVMLLFRAGFAPSLIAGRVGVPLGEVELIISLEQRKGQG
jgi:hypothetical protein